MMKPGMLLTATLLALLLTACGHSGRRAEVAGGDTITSRAELLTMVRHDGWTEAKVADPWKPGRIMASYALMPRRQTAEISIPDGFTRLEVPLQQTIVYSSVHGKAVAGLLDATQAIAGVADGGYLPLSNPLAPLLASGKVKDIGSSMSPSVEAIIDLNPDAILLSPYENVSTDAVAKSGAPLIQMADYMESTPLGRAEWLLLLGHLYGREAQANAAYSEVVGNYDSIAGQAARRTGPRPGVFTELLTSGVWYQPAGGSYMARLIADAGGRYLWADTQGAGSLPLDEAAVIDRAADADIWLIKSFGPMTPEALKAAVPRADRFRAFPAGVWVCDTRSTPLFDDLAFRPDLILADFARIFSASGENTLYYKPLQ